MYGKDIGAELRSGFLAWPRLVLLSAKPSERDVRHPNSDQVPIRCNPNAFRQCRQWQAPVAIMLAMGVAASGIAQLE